ncbi:hypothetical protein PMIN06_004308 [Paraphaeosphaeria minitans]
MFLTFTPGINPQAMLPCPSPSFLSKSILPSHLVSGNVIVYFAFRYRTYNHNVNHNIERARPTHIIPTTQIIPLSPFFGFKKQRRTTLHRNNQPIQTTPNK